MDKGKKSDIKNIVNVVSNVVSIVLVIFTLCILVFTIISATSYDNTDVKKSFLGYKYFEVASDSMMDTFKTYDVIVVKTIDPEKLKEGDIITFRSTDPAHYGKIITHKIRAVINDGKGLRFTTYGTTTNSDDRTPAEAGKIMGKYQYKLPGAGKFFAFLKTGLGYGMLIILPFALLILSQGARCILLLKKYRKEQTAITAVEAQKAEEQKKIAEEMAAELARLKTIIAGRENYAESLNDASRDANDKEKDKL